MKLINEFSDHARQAEMKIIVSKQALVDAPFSYANHIEVRSTSDEVFATFYIRQDYAASLEDGVLESSAKPVITIAMAPSVADRFSKALKSLSDKSLSIRNDVDSPSQ